MKKHIHELESLADDLQKKTERMAQEVREGGRESQEGFERALQAIHSLSLFLSIVPDRLLRIAEELKGAEDNGR